MKTTEKRKYRATVILDMRGREDSAEDLAETLKGEIAALDGEVGEIEHLGSLNFARTPDRRFTSGSYLHIEFTAPPLQPSALQDRVRLNKAINRVLVERLAD